MIGRGVIGNEIQQQTEPALVDAATEALQRGGAAEIGMDRIARHGKAGSANILVCKVRQDMSELLTPLSIGERDASPLGAYLPDAEEPNPVESSFSELVELGIGDVIQRRRAAQRGGALTESNAGVDLVEGWMPSHRDRQSAS